MNQNEAVTSLAALAHEQRLRIFRLLVKEGPNGMPAGEIADAVGCTPTGASFHLKELDRAGLIHATRDGLLEYLTEDCCQGQSELCGSIVKKVRTVCKSKGGSK